MPTSLLQRTSVPGVDQLVAGAVVHSEAGVLVVRRSLDDDFLPGIEELPSGGCGARQYTFSAPLGDQVVRLSPEHSSWRWLGQDEVTTSDLTDKTKRVVEQWWARLEDLHPR